MMVQPGGPAGGLAGDSATGGVAFVVPPGVSWVASEDGVVVLEPAAGKYFTFNGVAELVWLRLAAGHTVATTLAALAERFPAARERLAVDLDQLVSRLLALRLLVPGPGLVDAPALAAAAPPACPRASPGAAVRRGAVLGRFAELRLAVGSFVGLLALDVLLFGRGFARFQRFVAGTRVRDSVPALGADGIAAVCRSIDRGARFYFKRAWCLERSALTTWWLRRRGVPAELVIGVRPLPFLAHAWVEVDGKVVNDKPAVQRFYHAITRC